MSANKQYLIQFLATIQGDRIVVKGVTSMEKAQTGLTKQTDKGTKAAARWDKGMMGVAKRALMVAPMWMLMRGAIMLVTQTIREVIQANLDFQVQMARIKTVVTASSTSIETDMTNIRSSILEMAASSTVPLKDLAEAFYFLRTSNLSTAEAIAAFKPSVDLAIGTLGKLGETARTVAGIYATIGKRMGENMTLTQKFTKIADGLAFTYATQEVQMSELLQSYIKIAPYLGGLKESWAEIVTILGFLNTKQLKAGRTGRLLGRSILQIVKNSKQLAEVFKITYSKDEPLGFLEILKRINEAMKGGVEKAGEREKLFKVFATRGQVPVSLLLADFKELEKALENIDNKMLGTAEKMKKIMEKTVPAQTQRTKNILAVLANEFFSAAVGGADFVDILVKMNDSLEDIRKPVKDTALFIGWLADNLTELNKVTGKFGIKKIGFNLAVPQLAGLKQLMDIMKNQEVLPGGLKTYSEYVELQKESAKLVKERISTQGKVAAFAKQMGELTTARSLKEEQVIQKNIINLMKKRGATETEIAEFKIESFKDIRDYMTDEAKYANTLSLINDKINAKYSERIKETKTLLSHHQKLHTMFGADSEEAAKLNYEIQKLLFGENDITRTLKAKLELEKEILKTKRGQYKYTSDEAKIFKIYKKYGYSAARGIAKVAAGRIPPSRVTGQRYNILKEFFPERIFAEELEGFAKGVGKSIMDLFSVGKKQASSQALSEAAKLRKLYTTAPATEKQIRLEISKLTLPQPMDVKVTADVTVDINREQLESDVNRIVKTAIDKELKENSTLEFLRDNV